MRILTLPVNDTVADGYNNSAPQHKMKINSAVNMLLEKLLKQEKNNALFKAMDNLSAEAAKNELTIDKLGELMGWDEETMRNLFGEDYIVNGK